MLDINGLLEKVSKVKLNGGVVGKVCTTVMVVSLSFTALGYSSSNEYVKAGAIVAVLVFSTIFLWKVIGFADRNPQAALLEGSEFIVHEQLKMGSKNTPIIDIEPNDRIESAPIENEEAITLEAQEPDKEAAAPIKILRSDS